MQRIVLKVSITVMLAMIPLAAIALFDEPYGTCEHYRGYGYTAPRELTECQQLAREAERNVWWTQAERDLERWIFRDGTPPDLHERDPKTGRSAISFAFQLKRAIWLKKFAHNFDVAQLKIADIMRDGEGKIPHKKSPNTSSKANPNENTLLHRAYHLNGAWIDRMIELGMPVDIRNANNLTPLQYILRKTTKTFQKRPWDTEWRNSCAQRCEDVIKRLIHHQARAIDTLYQCGYSKVASLFDYIDTMDGLVGLPSKLIDLIASYAVPQIRAHPECALLARKIWDKVSYNRCIHTIMLKYGLPCEGEELAVHVAGNMKSIDEIKPYMCCGLKLNSNDNKSKSPLSHCIRCNKKVDVDMVRGLIGLGMNPRDGNALMSAILENKYLVMGTLLSFGAHPHLAISQLDTTCYEWMISREENIKKGNYYDGNSVSMLSEVLMHAAHAGEQFLNNWDEFDKRYLALKERDASYRQQKEITVKRANEWYAHLTKECLGYSHECEAWNQLGQLIAKLEQATQSHKAEKMQEACVLLEKIKDHTWLYCEYSLSPFIAYTGRYWPQLCWRMLEKIPTTDEGMAHIARRIVSNLNTKDVEELKDESIAVIRKLTEFLPETWYPSYALWKNICKHRHTLLPFLLEKYDIKKLHKDYERSIVFFCVKESFARKALALVCQAGADPNFVGAHKGASDYGTPLLHAVMNQYCELEHIKILLKHGADPHTCNGWGESPRSCAQKIMRYAPYPQAQLRGQAIVQLFDKHALRFKAAQSSHEASDRMQAEVLGQTL